MNLATPLGLLAGALALPLLAWYVLRSRRPRVTVASTFLWRRSERSVAAAVPWQRFRPDATFWLVLLALVAGTLALATPFVRVPAALGDHTILILDASASMLATEDGPTRLELARREAAGLLDRLGPGQEVSVIEAGVRARVLVSGSADPSAIADALDALRPSHGAADLADAFTLAAALERPGQSTVTHLLTDGVVPEAAVAAAPGDLRVTAVGSDRPNLAVTRLQAVPAGAGSSQVFVQVRNLGTLATAARLTIDVGDEDIVERELRLAPRGTVDEVLVVQGGAGEILSARVEPSGEDLQGDPAADALSVDDRAFAVLAAPRTLDVLIAGPGNVFLEAAFAAVAGVEVETAAAVPADLSDVDVLVVDRVSAPDAPTVPTLLVAPSSWPAGIIASEEVELPAITFQAPGHELLTDVQLADVGIAAATPVDAPALTPVASGPLGPLVLAGRLDGTPVVALTFDLTRSNLPLQASWPVLVANTTSWLAGPPASPPATAGDLLPLAAPPGTEAITVRPPSGDARRLDPATARVTLDQVGVWRIEYGSDEPTSRQVAVNADPDESDLARARPDPVVARPEGADADPSPVPAEGRRSFVRELVLAVLVLAVAEWVLTQGLRPWRRRRRSRRATEDVSVPVGGRR